MIETYCDLSLELLSVLNNETFNLNAKFYISVGNRTIHTVQSRAVDTIDSTTFLKNTLCSRDTFRH